MSFKKSFSVDIRVKTITQNIFIQIVILNPCFKHWFYKLLDILPTQVDNTLRPGLADNFNTVLVLKTFVQNNIEHVSGFLWLDSAD